MVESGRAGKPKADLVAVGRGSVEPRTTATSQLWSTGQVLMLCRSTIRVLSASAASVSPLASTTCRA
ncbi:hypothetical protein Ga0074812_102374 [Parafrankia irregularis]|uniref:Uncharacterized protein n=1 Tax=Parafrankia irregularis TaxID=795642 RepID=A0A0S4QHW4_9ACTN|nr:hypothetical protein Ga0074812_102374 [Parafrankia irregularis]